MKLLVMMFWGFVFYMIFRAVVNIFKVVVKLAGAKQNHSRYSNKSGNINIDKNFPAEKIQSKRYNISQNDIVEAEFTEIKSDDETNQKSKTNI
ncbi:MAG: hypothetical protein WCJ01_09745 [Ignavibacteria bacterium]